MTLLSMLGGYCICVFRQIKDNYKFRCHLKLTDQSYLKNRQQYRFQMSYCRSMVTLMKERQKKQSTNTFSQMQFPSKDEFSEEFNHNHHEYYYNEQQMDEKKNFNFNVPKKCKSTRTLTDLLPVRLRMVNQYQRKKIQKMNYKEEIKEMKENFQMSRKESKVSHSFLPKHIEESHVKKYEDILVNNNQNLQQMNMDVMNRLLTIIQNTQTANLQMQLSKVSQYQSVSKTSICEEQQNKKIIINNIIPNQNSKSKASSPYLQKELLKKQIQLQLLKERRQSNLSTPLTKNIYKNSSKTEHLRIPNVEQSFSHQKFETQKIEPNESIINIDHFIMESFRSRQQKQNITEKNTHIKVKEQSKEKEEIKQSQTLQISPKISQKSKSQDQVQEKKVEEQQNQFIEREPVFMEIPIHDNNQKPISLAQAFAKKIGRLTSQSKQKPLKPQRKQNITLKVKKERPKKVSNKQNIKISVLNEVEEKGLNPTTPFNRINMKTPQSREPSQDLMNRLVHGSKAKVSKKQMHALTKKNYDKLPEVMEKKNKQKKKELQLQRIQRIKQYQKSIRTSKSTIASQY